MVPAETDDPRGRFEETLGSRGEPTVWSVRGRGVGMTSSTQVALLYIWRVGRGTVDSKGRNPRASVDIHRVAHRPYMHRPDIFWDDMLAWRRRMRNTN